MSSWRPWILVGILAVAGAGYLTRSHWEWQPHAPPVNPPELNAPLPGTDSISGLRVSQPDGLLWTADFDYFYSGDPHPAMLHVQLLSLVGPPGSLPPGLAPAQGMPIVSDTFVPTAAQKGHHHISVPLSYPQGWQTTAQVRASLLGYNGVDLARQQIAQTIVWPDWQTWIRNQSLATRTPEQNLDQAIAYIDAGSESELSAAKALLEGLLARNPRLDQGYIELARIAMKSNWSPEALHQAEGLLQSALQISPDSANAKILLGYVYAYQGHFAKADALFTEVSKHETPNLWLWENWGESLAMQGNVGQAIAKYRETIVRPMTHGTADRAREAAYEQLLQLLDRRKDLAGMEALHKQRVADFGPGHCYRSKYAQFMLQRRGDIQTAIEQSQQALKENCTDPVARQTLGLAEYAQWAAQSGQQRAAALNQARIYLPLGPMALYSLAAGDPTFAAAKQLIAGGEKVDQLDADKLTALAYALRESNVTAIKHLVSLGARTDLPVGYQSVPTALLPVMEGNIEAVRVLRELGVDYSKLRFHGATAFDIAKTTGNAVLLHALGPESDAL
jgi:tetratricopeptide (TPR) repeat protein